ncbi:MAG: hypothetical protein JXB10_17935 [Pirellulales bacterium]|nr:hypothetical protein [Pirellulales bacterium]
MSRNKKLDIITFKVDAPLRRAMQGIANRSEFIRAAVLSALENVCPLCKGTGIMTPDQHRHWIAFSKNHSLTECADCHAVHMVCGVKGVGKRPAGRRSHP